MQSKRGHLDLFLRFLMGISVESSQNLLKGLITQTEDTTESIRNLSAHIKELQQQDISDEASVNLFYCLLELKDNSLYEEIQSCLSSNEHPGRDLSSSMCTVLTSVLLMSEKVLDEFKPKRFTSEESDYRRLIPAVLCRDSVCGRYYWETEWSGLVEISVSYKNISRKRPALLEPVDAVKKSFLFFLNSVLYEGKMTDEFIAIESDLIEFDEDMEELSAPEFVCHCCYDVLVAAVFPRINILLRDAAEKKFPDKIKRRRTALQSDQRFHYFLQIFQKYGQVILFRYYWVSTESDYDILVQKPINRWKPHDVILWVEHLGPWSNQYRETFHKAQINGSLLAHLRDEELSAFPFHVKNPSHRQVILEEIRKIKDHKVKLPQNLWEYKAANLGKSLFLQFGLREFPRVTFLYLYLFDYEDTFLPFIHTCCPAYITNAMQDIPPDHVPQEPSQRQWVEFRVKVCLMPYLLLVDFAWQWLSVHCWISWIVIGNSMVMSVMEYVYVWTLWRRR
ncbi:bifunctional apoptosis regulator-like [Puntigrus tetrazona]|uniref:bifunctional apoptosis regulator-like n=1 Tax=Puntigrus tetrazona TaxID=1606681 RepID=UPI001C89460D|nr:bifunctional apoptosis regulator-like [Puntigrus tetrazona]